MADADGPFQYRGIAAVPSPAIELIGGDTISERLRSAVAAIDGRLVLTTSFGIEAQLIAHHIFTERLPIEVVTLDTGRLFPETYNVWQGTEERYGVRIRCLLSGRPKLSGRWSPTGINGFYYSKDARIACCHIRKVVPLQRALAGASAWVTGLRADQSRHRAAVTLAGWDDERQLIKLAPVVRLDRAKASRPNVRGSVCRLTRSMRGLCCRSDASLARAPSRPGEPERAGRWWWERDEAKECGLHLDARRAAGAGRGA